MKSSRHTRLSLITLGLLTTGALPLGLSAQVWTGGGNNGNWSNGNNWNTGTEPASSATTVITLATSQNTNTNIDYALQVQEIDVSAGAGAFTLSGSQLTINGTGQHDSGRGIRNLSSQTLTINNALSTSGTGGVGILANNGNIVLNGNISMTNGTGNFRLLARANQSIEVNGVISGNAFFGYNYGGTFYLNSANSYSGNTGIWDGTVYVSQNSLANQNGAFGNSDGIITLGSAVANSKVNLLTTGAITIGREFRVSSNPTDVVIGGSSADVSTYTRRIILGSAGGAAAKGVSITAAQGGRTNFNDSFRRATGATGSDDTVTKIGEGIVAINGNENDYQGQTLVEEGTLLINGVLLAGGAEVIAADGTTLGGNGIINRDVLVQSGAIFSPGDIDANGQSLAQAITINGDASFLYGSYLHFDLGTSSDIITIDGDLNLSASLIVTAQSGFGVGTYTLFTYTGNLLGSGLELQDLPAGYTYALDIANAGYVNLIVVPEPATAALAIGAVTIGTVLMLRRRKGNSAPAAKS